MMNISHPGMSRSWFDAAVHRAHLAGCRVIETGRTGVLFVTSGSRPGLTYRVTRTECPCEGHRQTGRCLHRAMAIAHADVFRSAGRTADTRPAA